jgi:SAM-dependent methyltransferase
MTAAADHARPMSIVAPPLHPPADLAGWNRRLNETHAMAGLRARGGWIVRCIEERRRRLVAEAVRRLRPRHVIDVGCEDGWIAEGYAAAVGCVTLVDVDPALLASAPLALRPHVRTVVADASDAADVATRLGDDPADVIVLSALLEHLPQPGTALAALAGVLRPGGRFVIYLPADGPILFAKAVLRTTRLGGFVRGLSLEPAPGHLHRFVRADVAGLAARVGRIESLTFDPVCLGYLCVVRLCVVRTT